MRLLLVLSCYVLVALASDFCSSVNDTHVQPTRRKRSLTFPKGSAFVLTMTLLKALQMKEPSNWNLDLEFDMTWPLPKGLEKFKPPGWKKRPYWPHRRHRRDLYANFELALDSQGFPGNQCILRTICEAKFVLNPPGISLVEDLLRVVFSYPRHGNDTSREDDYDGAYSTHINYCDTTYPCPFSILQLLLHYNKDVSRLK